jgi:chemotaxis protein methyltransferase CheR
LNCVVHDPAYTRLKDHLIESTGLAFYADRDTQLADLINGRISDLGLPDYSSYAEFLADGGKGATEMDALISQLTIGETYFFRDEAQFAAIRDIILPDLLDRKQASRELRIWSAGCATGAEPYSLAILLNHAMADRLAGWQIRIYATDLNRGYLAQAVEGEFREWALRSTPEEVKRACFSQAGPIFTIHPRYKQWISFHYMNLAAPEFSTPLPAGTYFDLILCRNVMIYFAPEVNRRLIGRLHDSLDDRGWLVVGTSETSAECFQDFRTVIAPEVSVYQKMALSRDQSDVHPEMPQPETPLPKTTLDAASAPLPPRPAPFRQTLPKRPAKPAPDPGPSDIEGLRQLVDCGNWQSAAEYGQKLLIQDKLNPEVHFYRALIFENLGTTDEAEQSLRRAIYLDRNFALAHYHLGLALKRDGQIRAAARSFENVLKVLAAAPDPAPVSAAPGVTAPELRALAKMHLEKSAE